MENVYILGDNYMLVEENGNERNVKVPSYFICSCGLEIEGKSERKIDIIRVCPSCKKRGSITLYAGRREVTMEEEITKTKEGWLYESCFFIYSNGVREDNRTPFLKVDQTVIQIESFKKTGRTFLRMPNKSLEISNGELLVFYKNANGLEESLLREALFNKSKKLIPFISQMLSERGLKYLSFEEYLKCSPKDISNLFIYIRYPQLQNVPFQYYGYVPFGIRRELEGIKKGEDLYQIWTGCKGKRIRLLSDFPNSFFYLRFLRSFFSEPSDIEYFFKIFTFETGNAYELFSYYQGGTADLYEALKEHVLFGVFPDKKILFKQLFKVIVKEKEEKIRIDDFFIYLYEIKDMYEYVSSRIPQYPILSKNVKEIHDNLSKDGTRLRIEEERENKTNQPIPYNETEKEWEGEVEGLHFKLFEDTYEFITAGATLQICIANYQEHALTKQSTFLCVFDETETIMMCLQITNNTLIQAKLNHNHRPSESVSNIVAQWAAEKGIHYQDCYDLQVNASIPV